MKFRVRGDVVRLSCAGRTFAVDADGAFDAPAELAPFLAAHGCVGVEPSASFVDAQAQPQETSAFEAPIKRRSRVGKEA